MALTGITMFRARSGITDLDELIPDRDAPGRFEFEDFRLEDDSIALVYYTRTPIRPPHWSRFFSGIIDSGSLRSASSSAVVAFQREAATYLVTFGYGRYLINLDLVEPSFGLKATLNGVDPGRIRSIDRKRVDTVSRLTREQLSRDSRMGTFGLDVHRDLLSAVTGVPTEEALGTRIYGKDAAGLRLDIEPRSLGRVADMLEQLYQGDEYKANFPWVDNIAEVKGAREVEALDRLMIGRIREDGAGMFDLAPPEIIDWEAADRFVFQRSDVPHTDLLLDDYLADVRSPRDLTPEILRSDRVQLLNADGSRLGGWSVYRCLNGELTTSDAVHVISDGRWYRVSRDFSDEIDAEVERLQLGGSALELPAYESDDDDEYAYNQRVAEESDGELICLDQDFIWPRSWQDRIEFCDLFNSERHMIHVKRFSGGSAPLSHLFAQGGVSVRCLLTDRAFLRDVDEKLPPNLKFEGVPRAEDCRVVYAVINEPGRPSRLPFFSRVALRNSAAAIEGLGASVTLQFIENEADS